MCNMASFVVTQTKTYWSKTSDNHREIIAEFNLGSLDTMDAVDLVRCEVTPPDGDFSKSLADWKFSLDQDMLPEWYNAEWTEVQCREVLVDWAAFKIISEGRRELGEGSYIIIGNATVEAGGNATVKAWGNATVKAWGNATVEAWSNATVEAWSNATVEAGGNATVEAWSNATVKAWDNATVNSYGRNPVTFTGLAVWIDRNTNTIHARETFKIEVIA